MRRLRSRSNIAALAASVGGLGLAVAAPLAAARLVPAPAGWRAAPFPVCAEQPCRFAGRGGDVYEIDSGTLTRTANGRKVYSEGVVEGFERVLLAAISPASNQLLVAVAREKVARRIFGSGMHPRDVEREHWLLVLNPKSGEKVKSIDLGPFLPFDLALSEHGEQALVAGEDLHLDRLEVRLYNTRSGKVDATLEVADRKTVVLAADGLRVADRTWTLAPDVAGSERRLNSRDPYSIAEYVVGCPDRLSAAHLAGKTLAVVGFAGADSDLNPMLTSALALDLREAGFQVAERERIAAILDELYLQTTGATTSDHAVRLGRLANVQFLVFGTLAVAETTSVLSVRVVSVEEGTVVAGCEVACSDCRRSDDLEALRFLVAAWVGEDGN